MSSATSGAGKAAREPEQPQVPKDGSTVSERTCMLCDAQFLEEDDNTVLCRDCAEELKDTGYPDFPQDVPAAWTRALDRLDPSDLFRLAEEACRAGRKKADFREQVKILGEVARILDTRIRCFGTEQFRNWRASRPPKLGKHPMLGTDAGPQRGEQGRQAMTSARAPSQRA